MSLAAAGNAIGQARVANGVRANNAGQGAVDFAEPKVCPRRCRREHYDQHVQQQIRPARDPDEVGQSLRHIRDEDRDDRKRNEQEGDESGSGSELYPVPVSKRPEEYEREADDQQYLDDLHLRRPFSSWWLQTSNAIFTELIER